MKGKNTMKNSKKIISVLLAVMMAAASAFSMAGCSGDNTETTSTDESAQTTTESATNEDGATEEATYDPADLDEVAEVVGKSYKKDTEHDYGYQLEMPEVGETIAIIHTSMGDISLRLFPENAPNTVNNFIELAKAGKYDNTIFHRVIDDFMIQGGDYENGDGTGGSTYDGEILEDEFCDKLLNLRGAVAMANSGRDTNGSQFFINQAGPENIDWDKLQKQWEYMYEGLSMYHAQGVADYFAGMYGSYCYNPESVPEEVKELYNQYGGNPSLDGAYNAVDRGHTVFAQVFEGMDVVDAIAAVETDSETNKPYDDVIVTSVEITTYQG